MMPHAVFYYNPVKGGPSEKVCVYKGGDKERWVAYLMVKTFPKIAEGMSEAQRILALETIFKQRPRVLELAKQSLDNVGDARAEQDYIEELDEKIAAAEKALEKLEHQRQMAQTRYEGKTKAFGEYLKALTPPRRAAA